ncbi:MAG: hypothetical protein EA394_03635 [Bacteroidia bacterium]|nr:MAG: hypothetical protein EA394_03635 [Bacteroidia bacterium]
MLDIQTRKILFVQKFLSLKKEETISKLEHLLRKEIGAHERENFQRMTPDELNSRIDRSEDDFRKGKFKQGKELLKKYE